jgi:galactonate dehydratase
MATHAITSIEAWNLRQWSVLRLRTTEGIEGWGEAKPLTTEAFASLKTLLKDSSAASYEALRVKLKNHPVAAAVNSACLDILARSAKVPVYQFLGGPTRHKVRAHTSLNGATDDDLLKSLDVARKAGFKAFAVNVPQPPFRNSGKALVLATQKRMDALRKAAGEDCDFVLSGAGGLAPGDAGILCAAFERFHLLWFDEPCNTKSLGAVRKLSNENVTPLGFGEGATDAAFFQDLLREDAVDVVRPEIALHGISGVRRIAALAEVYYVAVAPKHSLGPVTTAAALHLAASLPNFFIQHIPYPDAAADRDMRRSLAGTAIETVKDGFAALPTGAGLGISVDISALRKFGSQIA